MSTQLSKNGFIEYVSKRQDLTSKTTNMKDRVLVRFLRDRRVVGTITIHKSMPIGSKARVTANNMDIAKLVDEYRMSGGIA